VRCPKVALSDEKQKIRLAVMCTYGPVIAALLIIGRVNEKARQVPSWGAWAIVCVAGVFVAFRRYWSSDADVEEFNSPPPDGMPQSHSARRPRH